MSLCSREFAVLYPLPAASHHPLHALKWKGKPGTIRNV